MTKGEVNSLFDPLRKYVNTDPLICSLYHLLLCNTHITLKDAFQTLARETAESRLRMVNMLVDVYRTPNVMFVPVDDNTIGDFLANTKT